MELFGFISSKRFLYKKTKGNRSDIMTLKAGELKLVETEESPEMESIWSRSSFETDYRVHTYES